MKVLSIKLFEKENSILKGFCTAEVNGIEISNISILKGQYGLFVSFPSRSYESEGKTKYAPYVRISDTDLFNLFNRTVLDAYYQALKDEGKAPDGTTVIPPRATEATTSEPFTPRETPTYPSPHESIQKSLASDKDWFSNDAWK